MVIIAVPVGVYPRNRFLLGKRIQLVVPSRSWIRNRRVKTISKATPLIRERSLLLNLNCSRFPLRRVKSTRRSSKFNCWNDAKLRRVLVIQARNWRIMLVNHSKSWKNQRLLRTIKRSSHRIRAHHSNPTAILSSRNPRRFPLSCFIISARLHHFFQVRLGRQLLPMVVSTIRTAIRIVQVPRCFYHNHHSCSDSRVVGMMRNWTKGVSRYSAVQSCWRSTI